MTRPALALLAAASLTLGARQLAEQPRPQSMACLFMPWTCAPDLGGPKKQPPPPTPWPHDPPVCPWGAKVGR